MRGAGIAPHTRGVSPPHGAWHRPERGSLPPVRFACFAWLAFGWFWRGCAGAAIVAFGGASPAFFASPLCHFQQHFVTLFAVFLAPFVLYFLCWRLFFLPLFCFSPVTWRVIFIGGVSCLVFLFVLLVLLFGPLFALAVCGLACSARRRVRPLVGFCGWFFALLPPLGGLLVLLLRFLAVRWPCAPALRFRFLFFVGTRASLAWVFPSRLLAGWFLLRGRLRLLGGPSVVSFSGFSSVGFSGSRRLSGARFVACRALARSAASVGAVISVGCAAGADQAARLGAPAAVVFSAAGRAGWQLAARSIRFVHALAASPSPVLVSFPAGPCPARLAPSPLSSACFCGSGSGSWATLALAVGLGVSVRVFLPAGVAPPSGWGSWSLVSSGPLAGAWALAPAVGQLSLF